MENRAYALVAGLFLLVLGAAIAATAVWFQGDTVARTPVVVVARMAVAGLNVKAPVKLRGVEVGKVERIEFDPADGRQILVTLAVDAAAPLTRGTYARLGLQGVTGLSFIDLDDAGNDPARPAGSPPRIELRPTLLDQLSIAGPQLLAGLSESAQRVNQLLGDGNQAEVRHTLAQLGQAATEVTRLVAALQPGAKALPALLQHADTLVQRGDGVARKVEGLVGEAGVLAQELRTRAAALDRLGSAAQQIEATTRRLEVALVGADAPPRTRPLVDELAAASRALERAVSDLGEQPQSLVFGRTPAPPGPGENGFEARAKVAP